MSAPPTPDPLARVRRLDAGTSRVRAWVAFAAGSLVLTAAVIAGGAAVGSWHEEHGRVAVATPAAVAPPKGEASPSAPPAAAAAPTTAATTPPTSPQNAAATAATPAASPPPAKDRRASGHAGAPPRGAGPAANARPVVAHGEVLDFTSGPPITAATRPAPSPAGRPTGSGGLSRP